MLWEACQSRGVDGWWALFHTHLSPWFFIPGKIQPSGHRCEALWMFLDSCTSGCIVHGFSCPRSVSSETLEEIKASKVLVHGDRVQWQTIGANARARVAGVRSIHHLICELHLPTFSEVVRRWRISPTVWPIGQPMPWEVGSTKLPFSMYPHTTVLPGQRGVLEKEKHIRI